MNVTIFKVHYEQINVSDWDDEWYKLNDKWDGVLITFQQTSCIHDKFQANMPAIMYDNLRRTIIYTLISGLDHG